MKSFWSELKRRNVVRVAAAYLAGTWLSLQIADTVLPNPDAPTWIMIVLIYSAAIGIRFARKVDAGDSVTEVKLNIGDLSQS